MLLINTDKLNKKKQIRSTCNSLTTGIWYVGAFDRHGCVLFDDKCTMYLYYKSVPLGDMVHLDSFNDDYGFFCSDWAEVDSTWTISVIKASWPKYYV